jgi:hypothetical protein
MDLARRISVAAAQSAVGTHDLQENKLIPTVGAQKFFKSYIVLLLKNDNGPAVLSLHKEYSAAFTDQDVTDINTRKCQLFVIYKKSLRVQRMPLLRHFICIR